MKEIFIDCATGEIKEIDLSPEYVQFWADFQETQALEKAQAEAKREAALAKLEALGLETDDLKALGF